VTCAPIVAYLHTAQPARGRLTHGLQRGVHVIPEKLLAHTLAEGQRLVEVAERRSVKTQSSFQNRYNTTVAMHRLLSSARWKGCWRIRNGVVASPTITSTAPGGIPDRWGRRVLNQAIHTVIFCSGCCDVTSVSIASARFHLTSSRWRHR